jgi:hypothetical protein
VEFSHNSEHNLRSHTCAATPHEHAGLDFEALGRDELLSRMFSITDLSSTDKPYRRTNRDMIQLLAAQRGMYDFKTEALQKALNQVSDPRVTDMLNTAHCCYDLRLGGSQARSFGDSGQRTDRNKQRRVHLAHL